MMAYFVYVLKSKKFDYTYVGHTFDLRVRLAQHNAGKTKSNKAYAPFDIIYFEAFDTRHDAIKREKYFKTGSGREQLKILITNAPVVQLDRIPDFGSGG